MIKGVLFQYLKGINGWSQCKKGAVDVAQISNIYWHKRLFKIFDRDYEYTLTIVNYSDAPTMYIKTQSFSHAVSNRYFITKRYKTKDDVIKECQEIEEKQQMLKNVTISTEETLRETLKNNDVSPEILKNALNWKK